MEPSVGYWPVKEHRVFALSSQQTSQMRDNYIYRPQTQPIKQTTYVNVSLSQFNSSLRVRRIRDHLFEPPVPNLC